MEDTLTLTMIEIVSAILLTVSCFGWIVTINHNKYSPWFSVAMSIFAFKAVVGFLIYGGAAGQRYAALAMLPLTLNVFNAKDSFKRVSYGDECSDSGVRRL